MRLRHRCGSRVLRHCACCPTPISPTSDTSRIWFRLRSPQPSARTTFFLKPMQHTPKRFGQSAGSPISSLSGARGTDEKLVAVSGQIQSLDQQQRLANHKLDAVKSEVDDQRKAVTEIQQAAPSPQMEASNPPAQPKRRVISVPGGQPIIATPLSPLHDATYSEPWPGPEATKQSASYSYQWPRAQDSQQATTYTTLWPARTEPAQQPSWTPRQRRAQQPPFLAVIQRNLRMLFR
jgi:hypothetical protein